MRRVLLLWLICRFTGTRVCWSDREESELWVRSAGVDSHHNPRYACEGYLKTYWYIIG
jgi:hypothetical protein